MELSALLKRYLPDPERLRNSRALAWLGSARHDPALWRIERTGAARGIAIGAFIGLMVPLAQIPVAMLLAALLRANLWLAAVATLISNPLTYAPLYYAAFRLGRSILGEEIEIAEGSDWLQQISVIGMPLLLGLLIMALSISMLAFALTHLTWWLVRRLRKPSSSCLP